MVYNYFYQVNKVKLDSLIWSPVIVNNSLEYIDYIQDFTLLEKALNQLEDAKHNYKVLKEMYNNAVAYASKIERELNELIEFKI